VTAWDDLLQVLAEHRDEWTADLQADRAAALADIAATVDHLAEVANEVASLDARLAFVAEPSRRTARSRPVSVPLGRESLPLSTVLASLRQIGRRTAPRDVVRLDGLDD
jgi:hypothetical protein